MIRSTAVLIAGGSLGIAQDLQFGGLNANLKTPNAVTYSGNLVLSAPAFFGQDTRYGNRVYVGVIINAVR